MVGMEGTLKCHLLKRGTPVPVRIGGRQLTVRARTTDLNVALECLGGEFEILRHLLPRDYKGVIVDAGGYIGTASIALREMFPKSRIILVEPSTENMTLAMDNTASYDIECVRCALTASRSKFIALNDRGTGEWGFTVIETPADNCETNVIESVISINLEELLGDREERGILKLDIEGAELEIFRCCASELDRFRVIFVELHDRIQAGCREAFFEFSRDRITLKSDGEKYLSIRPH